MVTMAHDLLTLDPARSERGVRNLERRIAELRAAFPRGDRSTYTGRFLRPLFDQALQAPGVTAWVAANDETALECLDYLDEHAVEVPRRISLIGFNDSPEAFLRGISSYNFNAAAVMHAMLADVAGARRSRTRGRGVKREYIEGMVMARRTTAPAPPTVP
jgi:DNA-binding LacI/PurR family transcriptional regulator